MGIIAIQSLYLPKMQSYRDNGFHLYFVQLLDKFYNNNNIAP